MKARTVRTDDRIKRVREKIRRNTRRSMRKLARQESTSQTTMRNIVKRDLGLSPFRLELKQFLTAETKAKRFERSRVLLDEIRNNTQLGEIVFSDEKVFTVEQAFNRKNDTIIAATAKDIPKSLKTVSRRQKPQSVMVWGAVSKTWKSPLIFVPERCKVNIEVSVNNVLIPFLTAARGHFGNRAWTFQQDGATSHTSKRTQRWCADHLPRFWTKSMWPPSSPDLNVMDFSIWSILESEACAIVHSSVKSLKASLRAAWKGMSQETVRAAVDTVPSLSVSELS